MGGKARLGTRLAAGLAIMAFQASPCLGDAPTVPVVVPGTEDVVGMLERADGSFPFRFDATSDRAACLADRKAVTNRQLRETLRLAGSDRAGAFRKVLGLTEACMAAKGWRVRSCGGAGEPGCPAMPARDPTVDPEDLEHRGN